MCVEIVNPNNLPLEFIMNEIKQVELEKRRTVEKVEFIDRGDGTCLQRIWFRPVKFDRIRRLTGYLSDNLSRVNAGKLAEIHDRLPHGI